MSNQECVFRSNDRRYPISVWHSVASFVRRGSMTSESLSWQAAATISSWYLSTSVLDALKRSQTVPDNSRSTVIECRLCNLSARTTARISGAARRTRAMCSCLRITQGSESPFSSRFRSDAPSTIAQTSGGNSACRHSVVTSVSSSVSCRTAAARSESSSNPARVRIKATAAGCEKYGSVVLLRVWPWWAVAEIRSARSRRELQQDDCTVNSLRRKPFGGSDRKKYRLSPFRSGIHLCGTD